MSAGGSPMVSVITPSFNQANYIRETIESVLAQDYPNMEHIVVDGGSTDGTLEILQSYSYRGERFRFVSEPDRGQAHAINKGLRMARGEIIGWLNSDDTYLPGAVGKAVHALMRHPDWAVVYGRSFYTDANNRIMAPHPVESYRKGIFFKGCVIAQPAAFIRKNAFLDVGGVDESYYFCMDYDLWIRIDKKYTMGDIEDCLAYAKWHPSSKTNLTFGDTGLHEAFLASLKHYKDVPNELIAFFSEFHWPKGPLWILNRLKRYPLFGPSPRIGSLNRYEDLWVPPQFTLAIRIDPLNPLHTLLVKGRNAFRIDRIPCSVYVDGSLRKDETIHGDSFLLEIPLQADRPCVVDLLSPFCTVPAHGGQSPDTRALSYLVDEVIPLSVKEYGMYRAMQNGLDHLRAWLAENRTPNPQF